jgi:IS30 family transposase
LARTGFDSEEREEIRVGLDRGESSAVIAHRLGRSASTISREVKRNGGRTRYSAVLADRRAARKRSRPRPTMFQSDPALAGRVADQLAAKDSPMTIGIAEHISSETIYQGIYANGRRGLAAGLGQHLHRRHRRRKARPQGGPVPRDNRKVRS